MKNSFFKRHSLLIKVFVPIFIIVGLVLPLHQIQAFFLGLATSIAGAVFALAFQVIVIIAYAILIIAHIFLSLVTSPYFISLPYTSGGVVGPGWEITRNFANMGFVFALLVIGLATALRIGEYHAKKTLPMLVGMILLINFTPVICGLVVDVSNILMNFFIEGISSFSSLINLAASQVSAILSSLFTLEGLLSNHMDLIARSMAFSAFCVLTAFFFFLFSILFIMRYVAIWILVILSPLAFFANVLPNTRKLFSAWWSQFFQWSFVGVSAAFFLYLAEQLLVVVDTGSGVIGAVPTAIWAVSGLSIEGFNEILKFAVIDVFLIFGFLASLSTGATGASAVMKTAKSWGKTGLTKGGKYIGARVGRAALGSKIGSGLIDSMTQDKTKGPVGWALRSGGLELGKLKGNMQKDLDSIKDGKIDAIINHKDSAAAAAYLRSNITDPMKKIKLVERMAEDWGEEDMLKVRDIDEGLLTKTVSMAARRGLLPTVKKMTRDKPALARLRAVTDVAIDPTNNKMKTDLGEMKNRLFLIAGKISRGETLDNTEEAIADGLVKSFGKDKQWLAGLDLTKSIEDTIKDHGDAYYAIAGEVNLERTVRGMNSGSVAKLSEDSIGSGRIQQLAATYWSPQNYNTVYETFGSKPYDDFAKGGLSGVHVLNVAKNNQKLGAAAHSGNLTYLFDKQVAYELDGTPMKDKKGNPVIIENRKQWDEYVSFVKGGARPGNSSSGPTGTGGTPPPPGTGTGGGTIGGGGGSGPAGGSGTVLPPTPTPTPAPTPISTESPGDKLRRIERGEVKKNETFKLGLHDIAAGQDGSVTGGIPVVIQGKAGTVKEIPYEVYKDPMSGIERLRKTNSKDPFNLFSINAKTGTTPSLVKNNDGAINDESTSFRAGKLSYRLSGNKLILEK